VEIGPDGGQAEEKRDRHGCREGFRGARGSPERAIGWVLVLTGAFVVVDALIWMSIGGA
jgi:hypothetical protein